MTKKQRDNSILIFVDMDDVLAQWSAHAAATSEDFREGRMNEFYRSLDEDWWVSIPAFDGARDFYDELSDIGKTKILSGVLFHPDCFSGKTKWLQNFFPDKGPFALADFIACRSTDKELVAGKDRILIDDRKDNIDAWEKAGGIGILHTGDFDATLRQVQDAVKTIQAARQSKPTTKRHPPRNGFPR